MEMLPQFSDTFKFIDWKLLVLIVVMARWSKRYLKDIYVKIQFSHKVLFLSTLLSFVYFFVGRHMGFVTNDSFFELLITYFTATSFYEIIYEPIEKMVIRRFDGNKSSDSEILNDGKAHE